MAFVFGGGVVFAETNKRPDQSQSRTKARGLRDCVGVRLAQAGLREFEGRALNHQGTEPKCITNYKRETKCVR